MRDRGDIVALVLHAFTGNPAHDLAGFTVDELPLARQAWHDEQQRRLEALEQCLPKQGHGDA